MALVEDDGRDPFLIEYTKGSKHLKIVKSFTKKQVVIAEEEIKEEPEQEVEEIASLINSIPIVELDLPPRRSRRSCLCDGHHRSGSESPDAQHGHKPPVPRQQRSSRMKMVGSQPQTVDNVLKVLRSPFAHAVPGKSFNKQQKFCAQVLHPIVPIEQLLKASSSSRGRKVRVRKIPQIDSSSP